MLGRAYSSIVNAIAAIPLLLKFIPVFHPFNDKVTFRLFKMAKISQHMLTDVTTLPGVQLGDYFLQFELEEPRDSVKEIARRELRETSEIIKPAVEELRRLLEADKDLFVPLERDAWLIRFLRPCKFYPESAYDLIKRYYAFKVKHHKQYDGLTPSKEQNIFNQNVLRVLPNRDQLGRRVLVLELGKKWNHNKCSLDEVFKGCVLFLEAAMLEPETQICGAVVIFDMDGLSMQQVWQFTPQFAKRIVDWLQESIPLRIKGLYIINQPYIFNMVFQLFKPLLKEKLRSRIVFMGSDRELLYKYISPKCLPDCYGGTLSIPNVNGPQWLELLMICDTEFAAINNYGYKKK
ncbi:retinaldehyde-binding protein 1 isoform X1 [Nymphalis io]|uniref:retinaldehyde-binding protein 1 isoform X1 n=1 Tax=Inachis io TaxID=171585 RepID=UPI002167889C|nr:retinaldehyde-binding protein 1 isoform X1 [Nymphalis io]